MHNIVYIVVEGQTEQTFVREVLAPWMANREIFLIPTLIGKPGHKGGDIRFARAKEDIGRLLRQRNDTYISTMFDYFRIEANWPGREEIRKHISNGTALTAEQKAILLEDASSYAIADEFQNCNTKQRFIPYIEMHEFEALLFSDPKSIAIKIGIDQAEIDAILSKHPNPEDINEDPEMAPSKRLSNLKKDYRKVAMGKVVSEAIGIQKISERCLHFGGWIDKMGKLGRI
jgi:hypothetical protein